MAEAPGAPLHVTGGGPYVVGAVAVVRWEVPPFSWLTNTADSRSIPRGNTGVDCPDVGVPGSDPIVK